MAEKKIVEVSAEPSHKLVFENNHVRVYYVEIPPGGATLLHRHSHPYFAGIIGPAEVDDAPLSQEPQRKRFQGGETASGKAGLTHQITNVGKTPFINVTVEQVG